jgi:hypothetical protein
VSDQTPDSTSSAHHLLLEIARCPVAQQCLTDRASDSPCREIVQSQGVQDPSLFQVPEPWSGDITKALILFIASNPSISIEEEYPTLSASDEFLLDFFVRRFGGGHKEWIRDGTRSLFADGTYSGGTAFWRFVKNRARDLLDREPAPGIDYALTEVVRCKSEQQKGVRSAATVCPGLYLQRTIETARSPVLVVLGTWAKAEVCSMLKIDASQVQRVHGPHLIGSRERLLAFLPHSNARVPRTFDTFLEEERRQLRELIKVAESR